MTELHRDWPSRFGIAVAIFGMIVLACLAALIVYGTYYVIAGGS